MVNDQRDIDGPREKITGGNTSCGKKGCLKEVLEDSIGCDACQAWYHMKCSGLTRRSFEAYSQVKCLTWVCKNCFKLLQEVLKEKERRTNGVEIVSIKELEQIGTVTVQRNICVSPKPLEETTLNCSVFKTASPKSYVDSVTKSPMTSESKSIEKKRCTEKHETKPKPQIARLNKESGINKEDNFKVLENMIKELSIEVGKLKCPNGHVENGPKTIIILNRDEPMIRESKTRRDLDRRRVMDILRMAGISPHVSIRRVHRVGVWKQPNPNKIQNARPILVEFTDTGARNLLFSRAALVNQRSNGRYVITSDKPKQRKAANFIPNFIRPVARSNPNETTPYLRNGVVIIEDLMEAEKIQFGPDVSSGSMSTSSEELETPVRRNTSPKKQDAEPVCTEAFPEAVKTALTKNGRASRAQSPSWE